jgi:hypothetical protein
LRKLYGAIYEYLQQFDETIEQVTHHSVEKHAQRRPALLHKLCGHFVFFEDVLLRKGRHYDATALRANAIAQPGKVSEATNDFVHAGAIPLSLHGADDFVRNESTHTIALLDRIDDFELK